MYDHGDQDYRLFVYIFYNRDSFHTLIDTDFLITHSNMPYMVQQVIDIECILLDS